MTNGMPGLRSSDASQRLAIYLSDHRAGSATGVTLARRAASNNRDNDFGPVLSRIASDIAEDIRSLEDLMDRLGASRDRIKETIAVSAEKIGRLKLNGQLLGYSPLSRLVEVETLSLGVAGKLALWRAVQEVFAGDPRLTGWDVERLISRATEQRESLEECRLRAAAIAFHDGGPVETLPSDLI
jgi:hypothetical protein